MDDAGHEDPLRKLFDVSSIQDPRELVSDIAYPYGRINPDTMTVIFTEQGEKLTVREKALIFLILKKAAFLAGAIPAEATAPADIARETGIVPGTLRPILRQLADEKLVRTDGDRSGLYYVPNTRLRDIQSILTKKEK